MASMTIVDRSASWRSRFWSHLTVGRQGHHAADVMRSRMTDDGRELRVAVDLPRPEPPRGDQAPNNSGHDLHMSTIESPIRVFNAHVPLVQTAELQRAKVDGPDAVVDFLETDVFADADRGHVDPSPIPPNAPVGADVAHFEAVGVVERRQPVRHLARCRDVACRRRLLIECLVRPLVVELLAKDIEAPLLSREAAGCRARGL